MFEGHNRAVRDLLAARGLVPAARLQEAYAQCEEARAPLADALIEARLVERESMLRAAAEHLGWRYEAVLPAAVAGDLIAAVPADKARRYAVVPIAADPGEVTLAAVNPFDATAVEDLSFALGRNVRLVVADPASVRSLLQRHYGEDLDDVDDALAALNVQARDAAGELTEIDIEHLAEQAPIVRYVNLVLARAIRDRASDVHFEPFETDFKIRCRVDGVLHELPPPPRVLAVPVISRLKVLANLNIAERRVPQDGRIKLTLAGRPVDLRVSTLPTQFGESVVLRVLDQSAVLLDLTQLGLPDAMLQQVRDIIARPNGIFIVTGPTGSGKTTTLYSCLRLLNRTDAKLLTVEDPVEYEIEGVMQVPVNPAAGLTFGSALRSFLRQDPDIVMVGEIRDLETAQIAMQASLTGHLVLTTLHTNDAPGAVNRLVDMGVEPYLIASTVEGVLAQRLVRRVCPGCREAYEPESALLREMGLDRAALGGRPFHRGSGCAACHHTGYRGRMGIFEMLRIDDGFRELVVRGVSAVELRGHALRQGMTALRESGLRAVLAGETTADEVLKYT